MGIQTVALTTVVLYQNICLPLHGEPASQGMILSSFIVLEVVPLEPNKDQAKGDTISTDVR